MAIITTDGRVLILDVIFGKQPTLALDVGLYTNNIAFSNSTLISDLVEPLGDYLRVPVPNWTRQQAIEPPIMSGEQSNHIITGWTGLVYGYFLVVGDRLVAGESFQNPYNISGSTQSLGIIPKFTLS